MTHDPLEHFTVKEILLDFRKQTLEAFETQRRQLERIDREGSVGTRDQLEDHETRIRANERARVVAWTVAVILAFLLPVILELAWRVWVTG